MIATPSLHMLNGIRLIECPHMVKRKLKRMCRSKKKRIIKKWLKNPKNYTMKPDNSFIFDGIKKAIYCHPKVAEKIIKAIERQQGASNGCERRIISEKYSRAHSSVG